MAGFWELMAHYRELTNKKGAFRISEKELGLMRDLDPNNQKDTAVMKLARKRFLEFTSSQKQFPANLERVIKESEDLVEEALKQCDNGTKAIDPQILAMDAATNTGKFDDMYNLYNNRKRDHCPWTMVNGASQDTFDLGFLLLGLFLLV